MWYQSRRTSDCGMDAAQSRWERSRQECIQSIQASVQSLREELREWRRENQSMYTNFRSELLVKKVGDISVLEKADLVLPHVDKKTDLVPFDVDKSVDLAVVESRSEAADVQLQVLQAEEVQQALSTGCVSRRRSKRKWRKMKQPLPIMAPMKARFIGGRRCVISSIKYCCYGKIRSKISDLHINLLCNFLISIPPIAGCLPNYDGIAVFFISDGSLLENNLIYNEVSICCVWDPGGIWFREVLLVRLDGNRDVANLLADGEDVSLATSLINVFSNFLLVSNAWKVFGEVTKRETRRLVTCGSAGDSGHNYEASKRHEDIPEVFSLPIESSIVEAAAGWVHCVIVIEKGSVYTWGWKECVSYGKVKDDQSANSVQEMDGIGRQNGSLIKQVSPRFVKSKEVSNFDGRISEGKGKHRKVLSMKQDENSSAGEVTFCALPLLVTLDPGVKIVYVASGGIFDVQSQDETLLNQFAGNEKCNNSKVEIRLQKVYRNFRMRSKFADCVVLIEKQGWMLLDYADLKQTYVSFFDNDKPETLVFRWISAINRAAKVAIDLLFELLQDQTDWNPSVSAKLNKEKCALPFLVTLLKCREIDSAEMVRLIWLKPCEDNDDIISAVTAANGYQPLIDLFYKGPEQSRLIMAKALGDNLERVKEIAVKLSLDSRQETKEFLNEVELFFKVQYNNQISSWVLILAIVSSRKIYDSQLTKYNGDLLTYAWKLFESKKQFKLVYTTLAETYDRDEAVLGIQLGLLCCQASYADKLDMDIVHLRLSSQFFILPKLDKPGLDGRVTYTNVTTGGQASSGDETSSIILLAYSRREMMTGKALVRWLSDCKTMSITLRDQTASLPALSSRMLEAFVQLPEVQRWVLMVFGVLGWIYLTVKPDVLLDTVGLQLVLDKLINQRNMKMENFVVGNKLRKGLFEVVYFTAIVARNKNREEMGRSMDSDMNVKAKVIVHACGHRFVDKFNYCSNKIHDRLEIHSCGCEQTIIYKPKDELCFGIIRSDNDLKNDEKLDAIPPKPSNGCYGYNKGSIYRIKHVVPTKRGDIMHSKKVWEPLKTRKKIFKATIHPDCPPVNSSKGDGSACDHDEVILKKLSSSSLEDGIEDILLDLVKSSETLTKTLGGEKSIFCSNVPSPDHSLVVSSSDSYSSCLSKGDSVIGSLGTPSEEFCSDSEDTSHNFDSGETLSTCAVISGDESFFILFLLQVQAKCGHLSFWKRFALLFFTLWLYDAGYALAEFFNLPFNNRFVIH